jgi:arylsulfatase A-like enzyme
MKPKAIILIVIDALRADHLGCYGYRLSTSPHLDEFSNDAIMYKYAFAPCSYTIPAIAAILTGKSPGNHSLFFQQKKGSLNHDREITLAEILKSGGYKTAAFVSSFVLNKNWGLNAGFDLYDDNMTASEANRPTELIRNGKETNEKVFRWLVSEGRSPFYLFVHYFDVHGPYVNKEPYNSLFEVKHYGKEPQFLSRVLDGKKGGIPEYQLLKIAKNEAGKVIDYERDARYYFAQYDGGIRYCDELIGSLINNLKEMGIYDETLILITADHGEALGENDVYFFHGLTVTFEQIRVPLLIKLPGKGTNKSKIVEEPVSTLDIFPTILATSGIDYSQLETEGINILKNNSKGRFILSENQWQRALVKKDYLFLSEKKNLYPNYIYYFDSRHLCSGTKLYNFISDSKFENDLIYTASVENELLNINNYFSLYLNNK